MTLDEVRKKLTDLTTNMDNSVDGVDSAATKAQKRIYDAIIEQINLFETQDGRFVTTQNYAARLAVITKKINAILGDVYAPSVREYLAEYTTIEETNRLLHRSYNEIVLDKEFWKPIRKSIYQQAEYYLIDGLADAYVQPAKYLLMQAVSTGMSLKDAERMMTNWDKGLYSTGQQLATNRPTPRLQTYATQLSRDALFSYQGSAQELIRDKYNLTSFIYTGGLVSDSRTFCKNLVGLRRKITLEEIPDQIEKAAKQDGHTWPDGMIPETNKKNFLIRRGGYSCRHTCLVVR